MSESYKKEFRRSASPYHSEAYMELTEELAERLSELFVLVGTQDKERLVYSLAEASISKLLIISQYPNKLDLGRRVKYVLKKYAQPESLGSKL